MSIRTMLLALMVSAHSIASASAAEPAREWRRVSPFTAVEIGEGPESGKVRVRYDDKSYALLSIANRTTADILTHCREKYGDRANERFAEDIADVLIDMGVEVAGDSVSLRLRDLGTGKETVIERARMTHENRHAIRRAMKAAERAPAARGGGAGLTPAQMRAAVMAFREAAEARWSYLAPSRLDLAAATAPLLERIDEGLSRDQFVIEMQRLVAQGIDGHAGVSGFRSALPRGFAPIVLEPAGERFIALDGKRPGVLLSDEHPYLEAIDGTPVAAWAHAAAGVIPKGSPQYLHGHAARLIAHVQFIRAELGMPARDAVDVTLVSRDGAKRLTQTLPIDDVPPRRADVPPANHRPNLPDDVGYVRIAGMSGDGWTELRPVFESLANNAAIAGVVIDVRGNGGGSRDALREVARWLTRPGTPPRVVNAAVPRKHPTHDARRMGSRFLFPADHADWSDAERTAVAEFRKTFKPEWEPPADLYGDWYYMVLTAANAGETWLDKPVVILMNHECFSATDVFLSALKGLPNVTLVGTPSGGGSANAGNVDLAGTGVSVRLGTMVSFQRDGRLFDTRGVEPDVRVEPDPSLFTGGPDNQLDAAVAILKKPR